jgi:aminopeptidase
VNGDRRLERYAELVVQVGANVQPGQLVDVVARVEHAPLVRALADASYRAGARYVDALYIDQHVRRAMIELGPDEALEYTPPWLVRRWRDTGDERAAAIGISGDPEPELLADLDPDRVGRARMRELMAEVMRQTNERLVNWCVAAFPTAGWAEAVFGEPDLERLWEAVAVCMRLDEADPVAAWREHTDRLEQRAAALTEHRFDVIRFHGPGTDLTVGLLPESRWIGGGGETAAGIRHVPNMPTEEVFTTPDPARASGSVRSTRPLALLGQVVRGLEVRFEEGRIVDVQAETGADVVRAQVDTDEGAQRLGEVALVDGGSRVGRTGLTFFDTLFDENATCHVAFGSAYGEALDDGIEPNESATHVDFMIGGPEVDVDAVTKEGQVVPLLRGDVWQLPD